MSKNDEILKYTVWQNTKYVLSNLWSWDKKTFFICLVRVPIVVMLPFLTILMTKLIIDAVTKGKAPTEMIYYIVSITAVVALLTWIFQKTQSLIWWRTRSYRFRYISMINEKRMTTDYENLISQKGQQSLNRAKEVTIRDGAASQACLEVLVDIVASILGFFLYGGVIAHINPWIVVLLILTTLANYYILKHIRNYDFNARKFYSPLDIKINYLISRSGDLTNAKDIRLYSMIEWFKEMYDFFSAKRLIWHKKTTWCAFLGSLFDGLLVFIRDGVAYIVLIYMVVNNKLDIGSFVLYLGAVAGFSGWLTQIINKINQYNSFNLDICDLRTFLEMPDKNNKGKGRKLPADCTMYEITLQNVSYHYPDSKEEVLKNINITIKKGEKLAVVGVNGAGKTTLVSIISGLLKPTSGQILINGVFIEEYNIIDYHSLFSAVFQNISFLPVSIIENIAFSHIDEKRVADSLKRSGLWEKVSALPQGIYTKLIKNVNEDATDLSGGEQQKLALARAIYKNAPILILDEPTAALDPIAENQVYLQYNELVKNKTAIYISHRLSSTRFCNRIAFLDSGEIKELGSHDELVKQNGLYANMFAIQSHYYKNESQEARCF